MKIARTASAGTLESSDAMIEVSPGDGEVEITIDSIVKAQFGEEIERVVREVLHEYDVADASVYVNDRGALDCTIRARMETALQRSEGTK